MYVITLDPDSPEYLEHFGVLGMHWGVRNSETQRKYDGGQKHSEARTDIAKPTKGHAYKGEFKPTLSKDQTKMLKRAAAGVAIGAGLAAGVAVGAKSGALKAVAKHGVRKLADAKQLQQKGKEFAKRVRTNAVKSFGTRDARDDFKRRAMAKKTDISKAVRRKSGQLVRSQPSKAVRKRINATASKAWKSKAMAPLRRANERADYYLKDPTGRKKARNRLTVGATGAALVSAPVIEGRSVDKHELRRKNGRHASTKWIRNKERLG